jgi:hypothetical protein
MRLEILDIHVQACFIHIAQADTFFAIVSYLLCVHNCLFYPLQVKNKPYDEVADVHLL